MPDPDLVAFMRSRVAQLKGHDRAVVKEAGHSVAREKPGTSDRLVPDYRARR